MARVNSDLISLNQDVVNSITGFYVENGLTVSDPRLNYFISGATWTSDGSIPLADGDTGKVAGTDKVAGSTVLANTTMETFHQYPDSSGTGSFKPENCFGCHGASKNDSPSQEVSHIFDGLTPLSPN